MSAEKVKSKRSRSARSNVIRKLYNRKTAFIGMIICIIMVLTALFGSLLCPYPPDQTNTKNALEAPGAAHWFGTDELGRDLLSRVLDGARISLLVSIVSVTIALVLGAVLGLLSGYIGGKADAALSVVIEAICAFPMILLGLVIAAIIGPGNLNVMLAIGIANTPAFARIIRGMAMSIRSREYVESAVASGLNHFEIITRYVFPNLSSVLIVQSSLAAAAAILSESTLSFMGLGVQAPAASWGTMLKVGYQYMGTAPWMSIFPGLAILLTVLALNFFGDGLRDALDVKISTDG